MRSGAVESFIFVLVAAVRDPNILGLKPLNAFALSRSCMTSCIQTRKEKDATLPVFFVCWASTLYSALLECAGRYCRFKVTRQEIRLPRLPHSVPVVRHGGPPQTNRHQSCGGWNADGMSSSTPTERGQRS
ncbi:hypothetical protein GGR53DRAFT_472946 [Hypoxylon sp. FL1150]|nr:hypothetical protein GGR53DRAFT_472946 [Hypoxylon sp. FL1150]